MKVVAINGSARRDGNTAILARLALAELEREGIETELYQLSGELIRGCTACYRCGELKNGRCSIEGDCVNACIEKMAGADGIILASPTYVSDVSSELKALIDRSAIVSRSNGHLFARKVAAGIVAVRRAGAIHALDTINHFFLVQQMIIVGSSYWDIGIGRNIGEVEQDEEGVRTMRDLGRNMAWLLHTMRQGKAVHSA